MNYSKTLFQDLPGGTEEHHIKPQSGEPVSQLTFAFGSFQI
jgi:hypothetical protein